jgi:hypothetical protein
LSYDAANLERTAALEASSHAADRRSGASVVAEVVHLFRASVDGIESCVACTPDGGTCGELRTDWERLRARIESVSPACLTPTPL